MTQQSDVPVQDEISKKGQKACTGKALLNSWRRPSQPCDNEQHEQNGSLHMTICAICIGKCIHLSLQVAEQHTWALCTAPAWGDCTTFSSVLCQPTGMAELMPQLVLLWRFCSEQHLAISKQTVLQVVVHSRHQ